MVFNRDLKHYENFTLMSHFVAQPAEMTHIGVLGTNVATISWLHWSPVSGYMCTIFKPKHLFWTLHELLTFPISRWYKINLLNFPLFISKLYVIYYEMIFEVKIDFKILVKGNKRSDDYHWM